LREHPAFKREGHRFEPVHLHQLNDQSWKLKKVWFFFELLALSV